MRPKLQNCYKICKRLNKFLKNCCKRYVKRTHKPFYRIMRPCNNYYLMIRFLMVMMMRLVELFLNPLAFELPTIKKPATAIWAKFCYATVATHIKTTSTMVAGVLSRLHNSARKRHTTHFACSGAVFWTLYQTIKHWGFIYWALSVWSL